MEITVWYSSESEILADWVIANTRLKKTPSLNLRLLAMSDGSNPGEFYKMPARLKDILYLDSPDLIISVDEFPILSVEISEEAGTGHNAFQRFSRLAAAVENGVASFYIYPEAAWISRKGEKKRWDVINPLIFKTLEHVMRIYDVPSFIYYFPTDFADSTSTPPKSASGPKGHLYEKDPLYPGTPDSADNEMKEMFRDIDSILDIASKRPASQVGSESLKKSWSQNRRDWMISEWKTKEAGRVWSPQTATQEISTESLLKYLSGATSPDHYFGPLLTNRSLSVTYEAKGKYRKQGDPYTGALAALDYLLCREGRTYEERSKNLVMVFGELQVSNGEIVGVTGSASVNDYIDPIQNLYKSRSKVLLGHNYKNLLGKIPRYMMQVRHGTSYTKRKDLRIYAYFADVMLFPDGSLWRES